MKKWTLPESLQKTSLLTFGALLIIFFFAFWLRIDTLDWGMPFRLHPDEWKYVTGAAMVHDGQWNPHYYRNPPGYTYMNAFWYPIYLQIQTPVDVPYWLGIDQKFLHPSKHVVAEYLYRPFDLVMGARYLAAFMGALTVIAIYLLTQEIANRRTAILASLFFAVSFANVRESHFAVNDTTMTFFLMISLWLGFRAIRTLQFRDIMIASAVAGISCAVKYSAAPVVPVLMMLWGVTLYREQGFVWKKLLVHLFAMGALSLTVFFLICPFPITDPSSFWPDFWEQYRRANILAPGQEETSFWLLTLESFFISEGALITLLSFISIIWLAWGKRWQLLLFPLFFFLVLAKHSMFFMRYCLPIFPWLSIFTALFIVELSSLWIKRKKNLVMVQCFIAILCIIEPLSKDIRSNVLISKTDTRIECLRWYVTQVRPQGLMAVGQYSVPIRYKGVADPLSNPFRGLIWIDNLPTSELNKLKNIPEASVSYLAYDSFATFPGSFSETYEERRKAVQTLINSHQPEKLFKPFKHEWNPSPSHLEDTYTPVTNLWKRKQPGPAIEIYSFQ